MEYMQIYAGEGLDARSITGKNIFASYTKE
jgi:hypothetical protein